MLGLFKKHIYAIYFVNSEGIKKFTEVSHKRKLKIDWLGYKSFSIILADGGVVLNNNPTLKGYKEPCDWLTWSRIC